MKTSKWIKVRTCIFGDGVVSRDCAKALVTRSHSLGKLPTDVIGRGLLFVNRITGTTVRVQRANGRLYRVSSQRNQFMGRYNLCHAIRLESKNITSDFSF